MNNSEDFEFVLQRYADADRKTLRDAFLQDPEGDPDRVRWAAVTLCKETLGFESMTGREFTPDQRDLDPASYLQKMKKIIVDGSLESLWSPDYKAFQAIPKEDVQGRVKYVREKSPDKFSEKAGEWASKAWHGSQLSNDELSILGEDFTPEDRSLMDQLRKIEKDRRRLTVKDANNPFALERIEREKAEYEVKRKRIEELRQLARDRKDVADYEAELMRQNAWAVVAQASKGLDSVFAEEIVEHALAHKGKLDPERLDKFSLMSLEDQRKVIPMLHTLREASDGRSWVEDLARGFVRSVVETPFKAGNYLFYKGVQAIYQDDELYQTMAEQRALLELANEAPMADWGGLGNAIVGVATSLPYGWYSLTGVGSAAIIGQAALDFENQVAAEGGDVTSLEFQVGQLAAATAWWGIERAQFLGWSGPIKKLGKREAFLKFATVFKNGITKEVVKGGAGVLGWWAATTGEELSQEVFQKGIENAFVAIGLGRDVAASVASGMVEEAEASFGTMGLFAAIGAGKNTIIHRSGLFKSKEELVSTMLLNHNLATKFTSGDYGKKDLDTFGTQLGMLFRGWISDGGKVADFAKRFGLDIDTAVLMSHSFEKTYKAIGGDAEKMKTAMGGREMLFLSEQVSQAMPWIQATRDDDGTIHLTRADGAPAGSPQVDLTIRTRPASEFAITDEKLMDDYDGYHISIVQAINAAGVEMTMEKWRGMTLEERRKAVDQYVKADEAKFTVADEDGTQVSEGDLARMSGTIDLNVEAMPGAQFHEIFHAVVKVLKRSGLLTKEVVDGFKAAFGAPLSEAEEFNEESGANNFQDYIQGKFDPVSKGLFDKFADGVTRLLTFVRGVRKQSEDDLTEYERFVESIRTGNIRQVPVAMAKLAEKAGADEKAKAEAEAEAEPKTAAPGDGATPPESRGDEQTPAAPVAAKPSAPSPTAAALPSETADRPGIARSGSWSAVTPDGSMRLGGVWGVLDLGSAVTSDMPGYLQELQGRSRGSVSSRLQIQRMGRGIDGTRLMDAATTDQGAPILTADFMVLSGNGRILALREALALGLFEPYRAMVRQRAAELGIDISGIANPVLVRILPPGMEKEQLVKAAELSNRPSILQRGLVETAEADAKILTGSKLIETMDTGDSGDLTLASNRMFMNAFIERTGDQSLRLSDGSASPEAYARVRRAALAAVFEGMPEYRSFLRMIFERGSSEDGVGVKRELDGIMKAAPQLVRLATLKPDYALNVQLGLAFSRYMDFRNRGGSPEAIEADIAQQDMFAARDEFNDAILRQIGLRHSSVLIADLLDNYAARAMAVDPTPDMFGNAPPTPFEVFEQAAKATTPVDLAAIQAAEIAALRALANAGAEQAAEFLETPAGERLGELEANVGRASEADEAERQALVGDLRNSVGQARHSIRARSDTPEFKEYMAAVEAGDRGGDNLVELLHKTKKDGRDKAVAAWLERNPETAKRLEKMVEEAAKKAGYTIKAYHGTDAYDPIRVFKRGKTGYLGPGIYLTDSEKYAQGYADKSGYGGKVYSVFAKALNPLRVSDLADPGREILEASSGRKGTYDNRLKNQSNATFIIKSADIKNLESKGYDSIILKGKRSTDAEYMMFSPNQIKSADPVTYDDAGNVIPLSERFNERNPDIRHSIRSREILEPDNLSQYLESKDVKISSESVDTVRETVQQLLPFFDDPPAAPAVGATVGAEDSPALAALASPAVSELSKRKIRAARIMRAIADANPTEKISPEELNAAFEAGEDVSVILPEFYTPPYNKAWPISGFRIRGAQDIAALSMQLRSPFQEMFKAVYLDKDNVVLDGRVLTVGLINSSLVSPHLVFSNMPEGTVSLIIGHNHPSGDPNPSPKDIQVSELMLKAGRSLGVKVVDHVITDGTMYYSMRNEKLVDFDEPQKPGRRGKRVADWVPQTADWEAFPLFDAQVVNNPELVQIVSENLRYVDSENVFVYVMSTKMKLLGVSRIKADQFEARDELGSRNLVKDHAIIAKRVARFGASNSLFVDVPAGFFKNGVEHADWFSYFSKMQNETGISHVNDVFWKKDGKFWSAARGEPLPGRHPTAFDIATESWTGAFVRESVVQQARMEASARHSIRARSVTPEQDAAYMAAVEAGDKETAQRMVDEAVKAAGYIIYPLYHGTEKPGFFIFNAQDNGGIFLSSSKSVAKTYIDGRAVIDGLRIDDPFRSHPRHAERYANGMVGGIYHLALNPGRMAVVDAKNKTWSDIDTMKDILNARLYRYEVVLADGKPTLIVSESNEHGRNIINLYLEAFGGDLSDHKYSVDDWYDGRDNKTHEVVSYALRFPSVAAYNEFAREAVSPYAVIQDENVDSFTPRLNLLNRPTTRKIAAHFERLGYDSVRFDNVIDMGKGEGTHFDIDETEPSTVYWVRDPAQVKMINPATYDDAGNVIPLSERFNEKSPDIRHSIRGRESAASRTVEEVLTSTSLSWFRKHPDFIPAKKGGDMEAANRLVKKFFKPESVRALKENLPVGEVYLVPVLAREGQSMNMIPLSFAHRLATELGIPVWDKLFKTSSRHNTDIPADQRNWTVHEWDGELPPEGAALIFVDDTYTTGQTISSMAEVAGEPVGIVTLAFSMNGKGYRLSDIDEKRMLDKAGITKAEFEAIYEEEPIQRVTGGQARHYFLKGKRGAEGLLAHIPPRRGGGGVLQVEAVAGSGGAEGSGVGPLDQGASGAAPQPRRRIAPRFDPYDDQQRITGRMLLSSIIATDRVKGIQRDESEYEDLAGSVRVDLAEARKDADAVLASINKRSPSFDEIHAALAAGKADELFKAAGEKAAKLGANAATLAQRGLMDAQRRAVEDADAVLLQDFKNEVGVDPARDLVAVAPALFDPDYKPKPKKSEKSEKSEGEGGAESDADAEAQPTPEQQAMIDAERKRREGAFSKILDMLAAFRADQEVNREKRRREAEERRKKREAQGEKGSADEDEEAEEDEEKFVMPEIDGESAEIKTAAEFAYVLKIGVRQWIERREQRRRERSGESAPGKAPDVFSDPVNVATYRKSMIAILRDIAKKWVDPNAAVTYNAILKAISEIPSNATVAGIELRTARVVARIQRNAVRLSGKKLMADIDADIQRIAIQGKELDALEKDSKRKVKGEHEATARFIRKMLKWSSQRCGSEIERLHKLINDRTKAYGEDEDSQEIDPASDVEIHLWHEQIRAIERWGGMKDLLPGEIMEKGAEIRNWLEKLRLEHQQAMEEKQRFRDEIATLLQNAIMLDPSSMKPKWKLGRKLADEFTATLKQRLEAVMFVKHMTPEEYEAATRGLEAVMDLVSKGSETYRVLTHRYRKQFDNAVKNAIQGTGMTFRQFLKLMDEEIPEDLNRKITSQLAQGVRMTWGNAVQLYASLRQTETYRQNINTHNRSEQAEMLKEAMPVQILRFISAMREVYQVRREELSRVQEAVTGFPVYNPDPLYMPVKIFRDPHGELDNEFRGWRPIPKAFSPRVPHNLDFDESAHIMDVTAESMRNTALAVAFGESGLDLRSILARKDTYSTIVRYHGKDAAQRIIEQVTDHLTDGYRQKAGGVDKIIRGVSTLHTYAALSWNASSGLKQAFATPAWAAVLDGGIRDVWVNLLRHDKASARELMESPGFLARYGAHSLRELIRDAWTDPSKNVLHRFYQAGMTPIMACDLWASMRVGVGVYKSRRDALIRQGVADGEARERAARATWALIEEAQQSDRPENTPDLLRRRGFYAKQMYKFQSANVLQFSHEFTALMRWRESKGANRARARKKFVNAVIANHLLMPLGFAIVQSLVGLALNGPPDDEEEWMKEFFGNLLLEMVAGPFGHIVFFGGLMRKLVGTGLQATGLEPKLYGRAVIPSLDMLDRLQRRGLVTMSDIAQADWDAVRDDVLDLLGQVNVPVRYADRMWWTWVEDEDEAERRRRMRRAD